MEQLLAGRQDNPPVHEKTKIDDGFRYGCNNHLSRKGSFYYAPNRRYNVDGSYANEIVMVKTDWIEYESCPAAHDHIGCTDCKYNK